MSEQKCTLQDRAGVQGGCRSAAAARHSASSAEAGTLPQSPMVGRKHLRIASPDTKLQYNFQLLKQEKGFSEFNFLVNLVFLLKKQRQADFAPALPASSGAAEHTSPGLAAAPCPDSRGSKQNKLTARCVCKVSKEPSRWLHLPHLCGADKSGAGGLKLWVLAGQCYELCFLARNQAAETSETLSPFPFCPSPCIPPPLPNPKPPP